MSNAHDKQQLFKLAASVAKFIEANEKISLPLFTTKLTQAQHQYPEDHTIGMISTVVARMANNSNKLFISRAEVKDLYEKFYSRNTKFANVFADELGKVETLPEPTRHAPEEIAGDVMQEAFDSVVDPVLASSLNQAFGASVKVTEYTATTAKRAAATCDNKFKSLGFNIKSEVACGKKGILICAVAFETPKGTTSVLVPVEVVDDTVFQPTVFVGNSGSEDLSKSNIIAYVTSKAGEKLTLRAEQVLDASIVAKGLNKEISDVDLALTKLNAQKESSADYLAPQIIGVEVETANPNLVVNLPKVEDPEIEAIAKTFDSELGFASFKFGSKLVEQGSTLVAKRLNQCGVENYNIAVFSANDDSITYSVALNGGSVAFKVPVKIDLDIVSNKALPPTVLICNGSIKAFEKEAISLLLNEYGFDRVAALSASPLYGVKPSELVSVVKTAVAEGNYIKAEDALNVLSDSDDDKAYGIALAAFTQGLKNREPQLEETVTKCAMVVKSQNSQHEICGHTGLPVHKVYQDKQGNCQPLYRKAMSESYEGATFMNSKVYL
jgi:hypothetical protein